MRKNNNSGDLGKVIVGKKVQLAQSSLLIKVGNVGIGTTGPASTLQVQGTANITSSSTQFRVDSNGDVIVDLRG